MTCFTLNGKAVISQSSPSTRLSEVLRSEMGLSGTKIGCNAGDCGACSVLLDDKPICSCLTTVAQVGGAKVTSIEGLNAENIISNLQESFLAHGAAQCGICTPGMMVAAHALLLKTQPQTGAMLKMHLAVFCAAVQDMAKLLMRY